MILGEDMALFLTMAEIKPIAQPKNLKSQKV